jgi:hypothetical protein
VSFRKPVAGELQKFMVRFTHEAMASSECSLTLERLAQLDIDRDRVCARHVPLGMGSVVFVLRRIRLGVMEDKASILSFS